MGVLKNRYNEVRAVWKILCVILTFYILAVILTLAVSFFYSFYNFLTTGKAIPAAPAELLAKDSILNMIAGVIQNIVTIASVVMFWKVFDKKPIRELGLSSLKKGIKDLLFGLAFGAVSIAAVFFAFLLTGQITVVNNFMKPNVSWVLLTDLTLMIFVGVGEEMFSRGYCMTILRRCSIYIVFIVPNVIFTLLHIFNNEIGVIPLINIFLIGLLFSYMYKIRGNIWMPIGYHITWNYFQGSIFGLPVSGHTANGLYTSQLVSENVLNGGGFGPEGGLIVTILIIASIAAFSIYARKQSKGSASVIADTAAET
jgi:hypothetical protein